jgi:hypothetical protein
MIGNAVFVAGGSNGSALDSTELEDVEPATPSPQYDPATIGREDDGDLIDVIVTHPTSTTTVFKNVTGSTNDFIFGVVTPGD